MRANSLNHTPARSTRQDLRLSTTDAALWGVMTGIGEFYFVLFGLAVGMGETFAGLLSSLPMVTGGFIQLISPSMVRRLGSHKAWVVLCAHLQAAAFLPLVIGALVGWMPAWLLFASVAMYWASGLASGSAWNTWITTLVPSRIRTRYFARRNRLAQLGILAGLVAGGLVLQLLKGEGADYSWFALLFGAAFLGRILSARCLAAKREPNPLPDNHRSVPWTEMLSARKGPAGRVLIYMLAIQVSVQFSGPYFGPYMRAELGMSYAWYMSLAATSFAGKMLALSLLSLVARAIGPRLMLWIGGVGLIPLAGLWVVSDSYAYLLPLQLFNGCMWAIYEMATMLLVFETVAARDRTSVLTAYNALHSIALAVGSISGGILLKALGEERAAYHLVFLISSCMRLAAVVLLFRVHMPKFTPVPILLRPIAVRFSGNTDMRPILPSLPDEVPGKTSASPRQANARESESSTIPPVRRNRVDRR